MHLHAVLRIGRVGLPGPLLVVNIGPAASRIFFLDYTCALYTNWRGMYNGARSFTHKNRVKLHPLISTTFR
jgi:hypothetical protein